RNAFSQEEYAGKKWWLSKAFVSGGGRKLLPFGVCRFSSASRDLWSLSASPLSRTGVEAARLGGVPANGHVAPTSTASFRAVNEEPGTVRPLTNVQSLHW